MKKLKIFHRPNLYDYLKIIALFVMILDHIGFFLFPESIFLRLIGRIAFPIFLFLVGFSGSYSRRRDIPILGIFLWIFSSHISNNYGYGPSTANILIGITITRFFLNYINKNNWYWIIFISLFFIGIHPIYNKYVDYGSLSFFFALRGWIAKYHKKFFHLGFIALFWLIVYNILIFDFGFKSGELLYFYIMCLLFLLFYFSAFFLMFNNKEIITNKKRFDLLVLYFSKHTLCFYGFHFVLLTLLGLFKFGYL